MASKFSYSNLPTSDFDEIVEDDNEGELTFLDKSMKKQNSNLDVLSSAVLRLGELSLSISKEIDDQNKMIDQLDEHVENNQQASNNLIRQTKELVKKSGGCQNFVIIVVLSIILIFLFYLVLFW